MKNNKADIVVVGSGIVGNATAYYLVKEGYDVTVLEAKEIGHGGSSRNGGGVRQSGRDNVQLPLAMYAIEKQWPTLSEELGVDTEYDRAGTIRLAETEEEIKRCKYFIEQNAKLGLEMTFLSPEEVQKFCPYVAPGISASFCPSDGHANPLTTTLGYYRRARQLGARYFTGEEVIRLEKVRGRARRVVTRNGNVYEADVIVVAAGYFTRPICNTVGIDFPVNKVPREILVTEPMPPMFYEMINTTEPVYYGHQSRKNGTFVFGGTCGYETHANDQEEAHPRPMCMPGLSRKLIQSIPKLAEAKVVRAWTAWTDRMIDELPALGLIKEVPGLVVCVGTTGVGFALGPSTGLVLSQVATGREPVVDISAFSYDRFKAIV